MPHELPGHELQSVIYGLFNDAESISGYTASNVRRSLNNELERIWKEVVVT